MKYAVEFGVLKTQKKSNDNSSQKAFRPNTTF